MSGVAAATLSIAMIAVLALLVFGAWLAFTGRNRKQGLLLLAAGFVILVNVLIWTVPGPGRLI